MTKSHSMVTSGIQNISQIRAEESRTLFEVFVQSGTLIIFISWTVMEGS